MLDENELRTLIGDMWALHLTELGWLDRIYGYVKGLRGVPAVPEESGQEVKDLARLSVKNVLGLVRDSFAQNLSVVGYRRPTDKTDDAAWKLWQANRMDARQAEVYRPALTYGAAYVTVTPGDSGPVFRPRSPRRLLAVYKDANLDAWPQYALETWIDKTDAKPQRKGLLYDERYLYPLDLGEIAQGDDGAVRSATQPVAVREFGVPFEHGATADGKPVCPVIRFVNDRDADDMIVGEIAPLLVLQQAINSVNFDRLLTSRFGAHPQKVITGWEGTETEAKRASSLRVWTFDDPDVKVQSFPAAAIEPYNSLLTEMLEHVAMVAQISPARVTGQMVNISAEALAAAEADQQRKLAAKRESFGEAWEQALRLAAEMDGDSETAADHAAEVVWRDTEARSFGAVVDGVTKLANVGVPIEELLYMVPGMTQQQMQSIREARAAAPKSPPSRGNGDAGETETPPAAAAESTNLPA